jgi:hypothetical protein
MKNTMQRYGVYFIFATFSIVILVLCVIIDLYQVNNITM